MLSTKYIYFGKYVKSDIEKFTFFVFTSLQGKRFEYEILKDSIADSVSGLSSLITNLTFSMSLGSAPKYMVGPYTAHKICYINQSCAKSRYKVIYLIYDVLFRV